MGSAYNLIVILFLVLAPVNSLFANEEHEEAAAEKPEAKEEAGGEGAGEGEGGEKKEEKEEKAPEEGGEGGDAKPEKKSEREPTYLEKLQRRYVSRVPYLMVAPLSISVIKNGDVVAYLNILVELKAKDVDSYQKLFLDKVILKDEIFCDLFWAMSTLWLGPSAPEASVLEGRVKKRLNTYYKKDLVERARMHVMQMVFIKKF